MKEPGKIAIGTLALLVLILLGSRGLHSSKHGNVGILNIDEGRNVAKSGMDYLVRLRQEGKLPGVTTNQHGNAIVSGRLPYYPFALTMRFNAEGTAVTNNYRIVQLKKDSSWILKRAWQTDTNGQIVQEWAVP
jgi:hypothetical protein